MWLENLDETFVSMKIPRERRAGRNGEVPSKRRCALQREEMEVGVEREIGEEMEIGGRTRKRARVVKAPTIGKKAPTIGAAPNPRMSCVTMISVLGQRDSSAS